MIQIVIYNCIYQRNSFILLKHTVLLHWLLIAIVHIQQVPAYYYTYLLLLSILRLLKCHLKIINVIKQINQSELFYLQVSTRLYNTNNIIQIQKCKLFSIDFFYACKITETEVTHLSNQLNHIPTLEFSFSITELNFFLCLEMISNLLHLNFHTTRVYRFSTYKESRFNSQDLHQAAPAYSLSSMESDSL